MKTKLFSTSFFMLMGLMLMCLTSCDKQKFHIEGVIENAEDSTVYLENMSLNGPVVIDSVRLKADGKFSFAQKGVAAPEFYRLRLGREIVNVSIDSTETVTVKGKFPGMSSNYTVEGSDNCGKIRELALKQMQLQKTINEIAALPTLGVKAVEDSVQKVLLTYKEDVKSNYIFKAPNKAFAYYALFQSFQLGAFQGLIFNPRSNPDDVKAFAAVATSWDDLYPGTERSENLHNIAIEGMKNVRILRSQQGEDVEFENVNDLNIIDLNLRDNKGHERRLTDLKGKVVLLDFHIFENENSLERIMSLRELWNKYHDRGFEIYQVSEDTNGHYWKTQTAALPWICVQDNETRAALAYNVNDIPTFFLIDRNNTLRKRDLQIKDLDAEISSLL